MTQINDESISNAPSAGKSVLITGGAGFIGSHLAEHLFAQDERTSITIVDDLSTGRRSNLDRLEMASQGRLTFIESSVHDAITDLGKTRFDRIYHLAAAVGVRLILDAPIRTIETNIIETARLLELADSMNAPILIASSSEVYGKSTAIPFSESDDVVYGPTSFTRWSYACTKAIDEYLGLAYHRTHRLPVVIARFFNTVGPYQVGDYGMVLPRFVKAALKNEALRVFGDGSQKRCFCDVRDVIRVLPQLVDNPSCHGKVFNVGSDDLISIDQLARIVIETLGSRSSVECVPYEEAYGAGFEDLAVRQPDLTRIRDAVGFQPAIELTQTIRDLSGALDPA